MLSSRSLLIVDNDPDILVTFEYLLGKVGFDVSAAKSGDEALRVCLQEKPRVVLSEVMVPGINGYDLCAKIKGDPVTRYSTRYILMTTRSESEVLLKGPQVCADYYITKPADPNDVASDLYSLFENNLDMPVEGLSSLRVTKKIPTRKESLTPGYSTENQNAVHLSPPAVGGGNGNQTHTAVMGQSEGSQTAVLEAPGTPLDEIQELLGSLTGSFKETLTRLNAVIGYIEGIDR